MLRLRRPLIPTAILPTMSLPLTLIIMIITPLSPWASDGAIGIGIHIIITTGLIGTTDTTGFMEIIHTEDIMAIVATRAMVEIGARDTVPGPNPEITRRDRPDDLPMEEMPSAIRNPPADDPLTTPPVSSPEVQPRAKASAAPAEGQGPEGVGEGDTVNRPACRARQMFLTRFVPSEGYTPASLYHIHNGSIKSSDTPR